MQGMRRTTPGTRPAASDGRSTATGMRHAGLVLAVGAAMAVSSFVLVRSQESTLETQASAGATQMWQQRIGACLPGTQTVDAYSAPPVNACLRQAFAAGVASGQVLSLSEGLRSLIVEHPPLAGPCHGAAHATGGLALQVADINTLMRVYHHSTCEGGFMHGMLDAFGWQRPTLEEFAAVGRSCATIRQNPDADSEALSNCFHGIGHAAWIAEQDPVRAARACTVLPDGEARRNCGEGILMDTYSPAGEGIPHRDVDRAAGELPGICRDWPDPDVDGMLEGCANGAAFTLSRAVISAANAAGEGLPYPWPEDVDWEARLKAVGAATRIAVAACEGMGASTAAACLKRLALIIPDTPSLVILDPAGRQAACGPLPAGVRAGCLDFTRVNH